MSTYEDHLAWLNRQADLLFNNKDVYELDGILAELNGFLAARNPEFYFTEPASDRLKKRYQLGLDTGKTKLMLEEKEERCEKNHSDL